MYYNSNIKKIKVVRLSVSSSGSMSMLFEKKLKLAESERWVSTREGASFPLLKYNPAL
jgi:hypothetical protein